MLAAGDTPGIHASVLHADGSYADILSVPGNVCGGRIVGSPYLQMQGNQVFKLAVKVLDEVARETLAAAEMSVADVDWLIPHQANVRILEATARKSACRGGCGTVARTAKPRRRDSALAGRIRRAGKIAPAAGDDGRRGRRLLGCRIATM